MLETVHYSFIQETEMYGESLTKSKGIWCIPSYTLHHIPVYITSFYQNCLTNFAVTFPEIIVVLIRNNYVIHLMCLHVNQTENVSREKFLKLLKVRYVKKEKLKKKKKSAFRKCLNVHHMISLKNEQLTGKTYNLETLH